MSGSAVTATAESVPSTTEPPPIAMLLPLLQWALSGSSLLFSLGFRLFLVLMYPVHIVWSMLYAVASPIAVALKMMLDVVLFTPFSIVRMVVVALYPVYIFCAVACVVGAGVGIFGHYVSTTILSALARSRYFARPSNPPPPPAGAAADRASSPHVALRKRKRRSVRVQ